MILIPILFFCRDISKFIQMKQKKLMLLGGIRYLIPVIETAHKLGIYVITCDYIPGNIAHKYSDEYRNVSIVDKDAVFKVAQELEIDGIMSFACDPGVVTAAYVAQKMGLQFQGSYESVSILQDKGLFRKFLQEHGFNVPNAKRYTDESSPFSDLDYFNWPVIVKPVDSAGSKGVTKVDNVKDLPEAIKIAVESSINGAFIIEDFLTFKGYHSSADPFSVDGKLKFVTYSDQLFDKNADNPYTPAFIIWPTSMDKSDQDYLTSEIQRLITLLDLKTGIYNIETCVGSDGKPYIMEVSPRGGGCKIAEIQKMAFGVDLIENSVRAAVGLPLKEVEQTECSGYWCEMIVHSDKGQSGIFDKLVIDEDINARYVKLVDLTFKRGDEVHPFTGANMSIGDIFLRFDSREELDQVMSRTKDWLRIELIK